MGILNLGNKVRQVAVKCLFKMEYKGRIHIGQRIRFRKSFTIYMGEDSAASLKIGDDCFFNKGCSISCCKDIEIGDRCLFGESVKIYDHDHKFDSNTVYQSEFVSNRVKIGSGCWFGSNVVILKGVTIGDNVIVAAGSIITKSIPSDSLVIQKRETQLIPR